MYWKNYFRILGLGLGLDTSGLVDIPASLADYISDEVRCVP